MIKEMFPKNSITSHSLTDQVTALIKETILKGEFKPGARLNEIQLSEFLAISRSPVREAIQRLSMEGFVTLVPRKGAFITKLNAKEIEDLFEVREALEMKSAALATQRATGRQLNSISALLDRTESVLKENAYSEYPWNFDLHLQLAKLSQNSFLEKKIHEVNARLLLIRHRSGTESGRAWKAFNEHKEIFECIRRGDQESALSAFRSHLVKAKENILNLLAGGNA